MKTVTVSHIYWFAHYNLSCPSARNRGKYALEYLSDNYHVSSSPVKLILLGISNKVDIEEIRVYFSENKNLELEIPEKINWQDDDWVYDKIKDFDIGIAPMVDHEFNRAKSAFKIKQYLSCSVPALASPVGENLNFTHHGENGFLCENQEDFRERILEFDVMPKERYLAFSKNAYKSTERFSYIFYCECILKLK